MGPIRIVNMRLTVRKDANTPNEGPRRACLFAIASMTLSRRLLLLRLLSL